MAGTAQPYPAENGGEHLRCTVCGREFDVVAGPGGEEIPDATAFLARHRKCLKELLVGGGIAATPAVRRGRWRR